MYIDRQNLFSDAQALTATAASTDVIDLGEERRIGTGEGMVVIVQADVALAGTTPTLAIAIQSDSVENFASPATVLASATLSALAAGQRVVLPIPAGVATERYIRLNYTLGGTTPTVTLTAALMPENMVQNDYYYADSITIS